MQTQTETIQQKAMKDIFALDEGVSLCESFGSQLDLGLPDAEDDTPKDFNDMLEVNPSNEPMEYGENFMSEGDDMADKQTQQFVVDEFAKQAAELPDGSISAADITGISSIIQMTNHITGDIRSFIDQTIKHAVQAQQQQNVSDAQPNGTVAQDIAKTGDETADAGLGAEGGIPAMEPIDPTAAPALDANPDDGLGGDLGGDVGDPLADMNGIGDDLNGVGDDLGGDLGGTDDGLGGDLGGADTAGDDLGAGLDSINADLDAEAGTEPAADAGSTGGDELDNFLDADDGADAGAKDADKGDDKGAEKTDDKGAEGTDDKKSEDDDDSDFNFEAIATKARGLVEGNEAPVTNTEVPVDNASTDAGVQAGGDTATTDLGDAATDTPADPAATDTPADECADKANKFEAQIESIVSQTKMKMAAQRARAVLESFHKERERTNTLAKLESIVSNLKKTAKTESIVSNFAKESKKQAALESMADKVLAKPVPQPTFESVMSAIDSTLAKKPTMSVSAEADKIIAQFEAQHGVKKAPEEDPRLKKINSVLECAAAKAKAEEKLSEDLTGLLESAQTAKATSDLDQQLKDLVAQVKNA